MRIKKIIIGAVAVSVLGMSTVGCYGSYGLTNTVHNIGKNIAKGNKMVAGIVYLFLGMPVGGFCMFADWLIFNTIEFWTGTKIFAMNGDSFEQIDEITGATLLATKNADGTLTLTATTPEGEVSVVTLEHGANNEVRIRDAEGTIIAMQTIEAE